MFSDLVDSLHYFSNDADVRIDLSPNAMTTKTKPKRPLETMPLYTYSLDDYPFVQVLEGQKREVSEGGGLRKTLAGLRQELLGQNGSIQHVQNSGLTHAGALQTSNMFGALPTGPINQAGTQGSAINNFEGAGKGIAGMGQPISEGAMARKLSIPTGLCIPTTEKKPSSAQQGADPLVDADHRSVNSVTSQPFKQLDADQAKSVESFVQELESLVQHTALKRDPRRDEDLIVLMTLKQFVTKYFTDNTLGGDSIARTMRNKININDMIMMLSSIKFKDKNNDMILVTVKQFDDIYLELLINPAGFKTSHINYYRGGKGIVNVYIFMLMNFFQQIRSMRNIFIEEQAATAVSPSAHHHLIPNDKEMSVLKSLIDLCLEMAGNDINNIVPAQAGHGNNNSAFQLHSQRHSIELDKQESVDQEGLVISGNMLEKTRMSWPDAVFNTSLMMRSNNMSKSKRDQYSFELNRGNRDITEDFLASGRLSPSRDDNIEEGQAGNMNAFVSNLLKKRQPIRNDPTKKS